MKKNREVQYAGIELDDEIKRLNRLAGQVEGVRSMLKEQRKLESVLTQCKAIHSGLKSIEMRIVKAYLEAALDDISKTEKKKNRAEKIAELEELYKQAS